MLDVPACSIVLRCKPFFYMLIGKLGCMATETQYIFTGSQVNSYIHAYIFFSDKDPRLVMAKKK
jgi:hypothetical protein